MWVVTLASRPDYGVVRARRRGVQRVSCASCAKYLSKASHRYISFIHGTATSPLAACFNLTNA